MQKCTAKSSSQRQEDSQTRGKSTEAGGCIKLKRGTRNGGAQSSESESSVEGE